MRRISKIQIPRHASGGEETGAAGREIRPQGARAEAGRKEGAGDYEECCQPIWPLRQHPNGAGEESFPVRWRHHPGIRLLAMTSTFVVALLAPALAAEAQLVPLQDYIGQSGVEKDPVALGYVAERCSALYSVGQDLSRSRLISQPSRCPAGAAGDNARASG